MKLFGVNIELQKHNSKKFYDVWVHTNVKRSSTNIFFQVVDYVSNKRTDDFFNFKHYEFIVKWFDQYGQKCQLRKIIDYNTFTDTIYSDLIILDFEEEVKNKIDEVYNKKTPTD